ncbi:3-hydroxybutyrate dehydrogenase [Fodinicurvata sediminis]|uniref:3-hydroxybutyrate dehydrogenase n=1 Tax=Fodinicurvata sediminis TaxID=1121832 RepID=UPI0003B3D01B|nr:3-hydroxybutyrate dehydrogenase [Fodinicurvata sediminis]
MVKGKTVLVTGSTSGIGKGIAEAFAMEGANIVLNGFGDPQEIEKLQADLRSRHGMAVGYEDTDLTDGEAIEEMMRRVEADFGGVDILVNNAGIQHVDSLEDFPPEKWDTVLSLNLSSVFHTTRLVLPYMRSQGWGRIINIASAHGLVASEKKSAYVAAKHGVMGLTKVTALETANSGITCNAICPGWVLTPLVQKQVDAIAEKQDVDQEEAKKILLSEKMPHHQFVTVEQLGATALYLCSPAADTMTGVPVTLDGGWTAR